MNTPQNTPDITVRDLAIELDQPISVTVRQVSALIALRTRVPVYVSTASPYKGDWLMTGEASDVIRATSAPARVAPVAIYRITSSATPEQIAEAMIRMDMALVDARGRTGPWTSQVMRWAVATAGHLFDQHDLWDYDLITDADHVHRCTEHRHEGPNTRGLTRRH